MQEGAGRHTGCERLAGEMLLRRLTVGHGGLFRRFCSVGVRRKPVDVGGWEVRYCDSFAFRGRFFQYLCSLCKTDALKGFVIDG